MSAAAWLGVGVAVGALIACVYYGQPMLRIAIWTAKVDFHEACINDRNIGLSSKACNASLLEPVRPPPVKKRSYRGMPHSPFTEYTNVFLTVVAGVTTLVVFLLRFRPYMETRQKPSVSLVRQDPGYYESPVLRPGGDRKSSCTIPSEDGKASHLEPEPEYVLQEHYDMLKTYLALPTHSHTKLRNIRAHDKILRLSLAQIIELSTDVHDELVRREDDRTHRVQDVLAFLPMKQNFHPKRNQARQKLSTLPTERFKELAADIFSELRRRFPHFASNDVESPITLSKSERAKGSAPTHWLRRDGLKIEATENLDSKDFPPGPEPVDEDSDGESILPVVTIDESVRKQTLLWQAVDKTNAASLLKDAGNRDDTRVVYSHCCGLLEHADSTLSLHDRQRSSGICPKCASRIGIGSLNISTDKVTLDSADLARRLDQIADRSENEHPLVSCSKLEVKPGPDEATATVTGFRIADDRWAATRTPAKKRSTWATEARTHRAAVDQPRPLEPEDERLKGSNLDARNESDGRFTIDEERSQRLRRLLLERDSKVQGSDEHDEKSMYQEHELDANYSVQAEHVNRHDWLRRLATGTTTRLRRNGS